MLADHLIATRRVRADDVASELANPARDSTVRLLPPKTRARLLGDIDQALKRKASGNTGDAFVLDPLGLKDGSSATSARARAF